MKAAFNVPFSRFYQQYGFFRSMCNYKKDLIKSVNSTAGTDLLLHNLKHAPSTKSVLDMVSMHNKIMNNQHIMQALRSLFTLQKCGNSDFTTKEILCHPDFGRLCRRLKFQAGNIELNDTIEALKVISYVGVPSKSVIVQVLLQLMRYNINNMNLQQIIFLDFLLSQFKKTPLMEAISIALPLVFEIQLPIKMDCDNVSQLADYLHYASRHDFNWDSIERIVNALMKIGDDFDSRIAKSIIWSICDMENNEFLRPLMKKAMNSLVVHLDELSYMDMETTLSKLIARYTKKFDYFYNEVFFDSCANYVIDNDLGFKHAIYVLRKFSRVSHVNNYLLDYMSRKVLENPDCISKGDSVDIYSIVVSVSLTDYRPVHWDNLKQLITKTENISGVERKEIIWMKFGAALCLLDIFKLDVLNKCLNEMFLDNLFKRRYSSDFENFVTIWQCIKMFKPKLNCLLPPKFAPEVLVKRVMHEPDFPLETALHKALGGEKYLKTGLYSKFGHQIDHVTVFRKGGYPVAMNYTVEIEFVEDIDVPADNQLVIIQLLDSIQFTLNKRRMKYSTIMSLKTLEANGYPVVPICLEIWKSLPDFERIPYLMQAIKEKIDGELNITENVI